jgi:hypothetical protein
VKNAELRFSISISELFCNFDKRLPETNNCNMKRIALASCLLLLLSLNSFGQWYQKKYQVTDINALSLDQLQESLQDSRSGTYLSLGFAGLGGLLILGGIYLPYEVNEDSGFWEQLIGSKGMNYLITGVGVICAVGGTISTFNFLGRISKIKNTMRRNYPVTGSLNITPKIIFNKYSGTSSAGVALTINF